MNNIVFLSPNSLQCTYENTDLQQNILTFFSTKNNQFLDFPTPFIEKYVDGFKTLLNTIQPEDIVYFTLTPGSNLDKTKQFVMDLVLASEFNKAACIVYDYSHCASVDCAKATFHCQEIKEILDQCEVPVVFLDNSYTIKFNAVSPIHIIDIPHLNKIIKYIHQIFDIKSSVHFAIEAPLNRVQFKSKIKQIEIEDYLFHLN